MTDLLTLSYTSTSEITSWSLPVYATIGCAPRALKAVFNRANLYRKGGLNVVYYLDKILCEPHFDVICDLLLNILTATWNLFVLSETHSFWFYTMHRKV